MRTMTACAALALVGSLAGGVGPAEAGGDVVSRDEFRKVQTNWSKTRVHKVFGTSGTITGRESGNPEFCTAEEDWADCPGQERSYDATGTHTALLWFVKKDGVWRLESKSWH